MLSGVNADGIKQIVQCGDGRYWTILLVQSVLFKKIFGKSERIAMCFCDNSYIRRITPTHRYCKGNLFCFEHRKNQLVSFFTALHTHF